MPQTNYAHPLDPDTHHAARHADPLACGERRLMLAVLEDALRTVLSARVGRSCDAWVREELRWFMSDDRSHSFAFEVICDVLDLDASWLRRRLRSDTRRGRSYRGNRVQHHATPG